MAYGSLAQRLWTRVDKSGDCWTWQGHRTAAGYGQMGRGGAIEGLAYTHRVAYELEYGPVPHGLLVCHRCDNPPCVRPDHLFLGTPGDNIRDAAAKGRLVTLRGEAHPSHRLKWDQVVQIRSLRAAGLPSAAVAERFGVSVQHINDIIRFRKRRDS